MMLRRTMRKGFLHESRTVSARIAGSPISDVSKILIMNAYFEFQSSHAFYACKCDLACKAISGCRVCGLAAYRPYKRAFLLPLAPSSACL
jgi:hypothetical protein